MKDSTIVCIQKSEGPNIKSHQRYLGITVGVCLQVLGDRETMGRLLLTQASLAAAEKRVGDCITHVCEALVSPTTTQ